MQSSTHSTHLRFCRNTYEDERCAFQTYTEVQFQHHCQRFDEKRSSRIVDSVVSFHTQHGRHSVWILETFAYLQEITVHPRLKSIVLSRWSAYQVPNTVILLSKLAGDTDHVDS